MVTYFRTSPGWCEIFFREDIDKWCDEQFDYPIQIEVKSFENQRAKLKGTMIIATFRNDLDCIHFKMRWM